MTNNDKAMFEAWWETLGDTSTCITGAQRGFIAGYQAASQANRWQPIESAPDGVELILYCPTRCAVTNRERIEIGTASYKGSHHSWATHWQSLPKPPTTGE